MEQNTQRKTDTSTHLRSASESDRDGNFNYKIRTNKITKQNNVMCTVYLIATTTPATYLLITHDEQ